MKKRSKLSSELNTFVSLLLCVVILFQAVICMYCLRLIGDKKKAWQRLIITVAGAATNILVGALVMAILVCASPDTLGTTQIAVFNEESVTDSQGLQVGDVIKKVENHSVHISDELMYEITRLGIKPVDVTVDRNGETVVVEDVSFPQTSSQGIAFGTTDFKVWAVKDPTILTFAKHALFKTTYTVRMIWESLYDLVTGRYGIEAVSGPVGVTKELTRAADTGIYTFTYFAVVISINLGVMNLLPLPALDGGRIVFLLIEAVRRKPLKMEIEAYINFAGLVLLMLLMVFICIKDVISLF